MQLKRLQYYVKAYTRFLYRQEAEERLYMWESQAVFQEYWNLNSPDWPTMYDNALQNTTNRRLWKRESFEPKRIMLLFFSMEPEYVIQAFRDLLNEGKSVDSRMDRFVFYCDELLAMYKDRHPHSIENNHYHANDYDMISLYLSFCYPQYYAPYNLERFTSLLKRLGVGNLPKANDPIRFFKVVNTIYKLMQKEEELMSANRRRIEKQRKCFQGESLLLVHDFICYVTDPKYVNQNLLKLYVGK